MRTLHFLHIETQHQLTFFIDVCPRRYDQRVMRSFTETRRLTRQTPPAVPAARSRAQVRAANQGVQQLFRSPDKEADKAPEKPKAPPKPKCLTGCAQRWGQDTTCSKWGFQQGRHEREPQYLIDVVGKKLRLTACCNTWPFAVEKFARESLGIAGAASCPVQHEKEIATVTSGESEVQVLCSDTIPASMVGETAKAADCQGDIDKEIIEMSPKAMEDLSGQTAHALHVKVCFSGSKEDLCLHNGPGKARFPEVEDCLTSGCTPPADLPRLKDTGWPRV
jgi:hypothetical protein